jgi:hypothetical protein
MTEVKPATFPMSSDKKRLMRDGEEWTDDERFAWV